MIRIRNLSKSFAERLVLSDISAEVPAGSVIALVGASGSGKSTLLRCLNALESFDRGQIEIAGHRLDARTGEHELNRLRAAVGMVFQEYHLFPHLSVLDNVALAPRVVSKLERKQANRVAMGWLERVGLADRARARPQELSGGQRQRVALARALAQSVRVLLLDEPTSALDPALRFEVGELLRELTRASSAADAPLTSVLVTHDLELAHKLADEVWELAGGQLRLPS
ncbi:MAG TPA: amino acid ABC transporter ATP-binding protein [Polyangiaceae bacterium]|nr:amino acid ABC transporter ATP-binding protein [Polyangiaceae bacterium]